MAVKKRAKAVSAQTVSDTDVIDLAASASRAKALAFISHDSRDADLAEAFANLLSDVSAGTLKSFRSSDKKGTSGIEFGAEWYTAIMSQLDQATDVVALLTAQSIDRPWILYEAGVAKGKLETTVFGIALGVPLEKVSTGPFGQFQNCGDDEESLTKLVMQLLQRNPDAAPREEAVKTQVRVFRQNVESILKARGKVKVSETPAPEENIAKLFEEVKAMVRELPERVDERIVSVSYRGQGRRRIHPGMVEELLFGSWSSSRDKAEFSIVWLVAISLVKDDLPWFYELGIDLYRALQTHKRMEVRKASERLLRAIDLSKNSKLVYRFARGDGEESLFLLRQFGEFLRRLFDETALPFDDVSGPEGKRPKIAPGRNKSR